MAAVGLHAPLGPRRLLGVEAGGDPLPPDVRAELEGHTGVSLDAVRIHGGAAARRAAISVSSRAYTFGSDIVVGDHLDLDVPADRRLLAHEIGHVARHTARHPELAFRNGDETLEQRFAAFRQSVLTAAVHRLTQNRENLTRWRTVIEDELSGLEVQRQAYGATALDLFQTALDHGTMRAFDEWTTEDNPYMRYVREKQVGGEWQACMGCHGAMWAEDQGHREPHVGLRWTPPVVSLSGMAASPPTIDAERAQRIMALVSGDPTCPGVPGAPPLREQGSSAMTLLDRDLVMAGLTHSFAGSMPSSVPSAHGDVGLSPAVRLTVESAARLGALLAPLAGHGYRIIPPETLSLLSGESPERLREMILANLDQRDADYAELQGRIEAGDVDYLDLEVVLEEMLVDASQEIRDQVASDRSDRAFWRAIEGIVTLAATLLTPLFPPLGLLAGGLMIHQGWESYQTGYTYSLGQGANNVFTPWQQDQADSMMLGGGMMIAMGMLQIGASLPPSVQMGVAASDAVATRLAVITDTQMARALAARAQSGPIPAAEVEAIVGRPTGVRGLAHRYLDWRGYDLFYRGQAQLGPGQRMVSPLARPTTEGGPYQLDASLAMEQAATGEGLTLQELAGYTARYNGEPVPAFDLPPNSALAGEPVGGAGIPVTRNPGVAADFAGQFGGPRATVYVIRVPRGTAIDAGPGGWGPQGATMSTAESEWVILHEVNGQYIWRALPPDGIPALRAESLDTGGFGLGVPR